MSTLTYPAAVEADVIGQPYQGTHTLGNWQSDNAIDLAIPAGSEILAVVDGTITRLSGPFTSDMSTQFSGGSIYLAGGGQTFFYEHVAKSLVRVGQRVRAGQPIGIAGGANGVEHLHLAVEPPGDPRDILEGSTQPTATEIRPINAAGAAGDAAKGILDKAGGGGAAIAKAFVNLVWDALGEDGTRILLYLALVGGGAATAYVGLARMLGLRAPVAGAAAA